MSRIISIVFGFTIASTLLPAHPVYFLIALFVGIIVISALSYWTDF